MKHRNEACSAIFKLKNKIKIELAKMEFCSNRDKIVGREAGNAP